ncbi:hypothetical protein [Citrobacter braakii]|uniref:hypothetical protein n=1 Tax=Citrobacter braakii TaxID=57706 RepID=UPI001908B08D|nr:hypothetical protein [Citrobacter braakii]MBJ9239103.1 hypothetical protein [Citrobacter braakii]
MSVKPVAIQLDADGKLPNEFKNYLSAVYSSSMEAEGTVANLGWQQKFEALGLDKDTAAAMVATVPAMIAAKGPKGSSLPTPNSTPAANGLNYQSNPKHTPGQSGYSFKAGTEPKNSMDLFGSAVVSGKKCTRKMQKVLFINLQIQMMELGIGQVVQGTSLYR